MNDRFDLDNAIHTLAEFSYAIAVMDKIEGWEEESWVGSKFAASMWIHTKAVICNGQDNMQEYRVLKCRSMMEAVNWVCDDALGDHVWVSELTISCQEAKVFGSSAIRPCKPMHSPVGYVVVLGTEKSLSEVFERWRDPRKNTMKQSIWLFGLLSCCLSG